MTTAHRPTWKAALGEASDYGNWSTGGKVSGQFSVKDLPSHTKLKLRTGAQIPDFQSKQDVLQAEAQASEAKRKASKKSLLEDDAELESKILSSAKPLLLTENEVDIERVSKKYDDADDESDSDLESSDDSDDDDDDELEEELLQRELEKIRKEREEAKLKKEMEESEDSLREKSKAAMESNPLLSASQQVKRKWNDDVVFKNQARSEPEIKKRFVNDTIRNDFHRRFLSKYMK